MWPHFHTQERDLPFVSTTTTTTFESYNATSQPYIGSVTVNTEANSSFGNGDVVREAIQEVQEFAKTVAVVRDAFVEVESALYNFDAVVSARGVNRRKLAPEWRNFHQVCAFMLISHLLWCSTQLIKTGV
jgi:hypothetical protein